MSIESPSAGRVAPSVRRDWQRLETAPESPPRRSLTEQPWRFLALLGLSAVFVLYAGARLDPGPDEGRLGLAAMEPFGPLGQAFGGWEPRVWPGTLLVTQLWAWGEGATPTGTAIRWPAAIAAVVAGLILARRGSTVIGGRAGLLIGLAWYGSVGLMDRSEVTGLDMLTGLFALAALDRILGKGSDLGAGAWLALAFLCGGWPSVAIAMMAVVVLGRNQASLSWRLLLPPALTIVGWSAWALSRMPAEAWGAALAAPFTEKPAWWLIPGVLTLGLPWSPLAALVGARSIREGWDAPGRGLVIGWLQIAGCALVAGTLIPGLAVAARVPALAGLAVAAGAGLDRMLAGCGVGSRFARGWLLASIVGMTAAWTLICVLAGGYLAAAVPYYRPLTIGLIIACVPLLWLALGAVSRREPRMALLVMIVLAVGLKAGHAGYFVPEWNYRRSQGPWGRAIGQWVPPGWPIYTVHAWPADLALATGRPFRHLGSEWHLRYQPGDVKFVLLLQSEFEHWPEKAPPIVKEAELLDEFGGVRILARTPGDLPWVRDARTRGPGLPLGDDDR